MVLREVFLFDTYCISWGKYIAQKKKNDVNFDIIELFLRLGSGSPAGPEEHGKQYSPKLIYLLPV